VREKPIAHALLGLNATAQRCLNYLQTKWLSAHVRGKQTAHVQELNAIAKWRLSVNVKGMKNVIAER
jgi:hypothetical protein